MAAKKPVPYKNNFMPEKPARPLSRSLGPTQKYNHVQSSIKGQIEYHKRLYKQQQENGRDNTAKKDA